ncbi:MAG TPA: Zn-dependent hydrolase [Vicinamibacterales bacterium]|nr:Zn-dependent hydrolase [Vicinamibacterales bacterium]
MTRREFGAALVGGAAAASLFPTAVAARRRAALRVNGERLNARLAEIGRFGANPQGGVTRLGYSEEDRQARALVATWMRDAGLDPSTDFAGNLFGRRAGSEPALRPLVFGSHVDSVPEGGNFDGNVGVLAAIEVARTLRERGTTPRHPIEVVVWANEEGGLFGSRAVSGQFDASELSHVTMSGKTVKDGIAFVGGDPDRIDEVRRSRGDIAGYIELHIEQGGVLEAERTTIGVVEGIVGIRWWNVTVTGFANHAGTTPMDRRQDAMLAAARFIDMVNRVVTSAPGRHVGTVGRIRAVPGAPNVIPGTVECSLELRDLDDGQILRLFEGIRGEARRIAEATGTSIAFDELHVNAPAPSDPRMRQVIADSAASLGLSSRAMPSGAGHDAQAMAQLGPMGMIFIQSVGGISHSPKEFSHAADIVHGANVLLGAVLAADQTR